MKELIDAYNGKKEIIKNRLEDFKKLNEEDIFYEMCFCLLTPQSKAHTCWSTVLALKSRDFKNKDFSPANFVNGVRFHNNKTIYLLEAKEKFNLLKDELKEIKDSFELREWVIENIKGMGYKESAHFLRNIGYNNLAILDRHILKNLKKYNVINEIPKTLTKKRYLEIEGKFKEFANNVGISMDELDLLFWSMETGEVFK